MAAPRNAMNDTPKNIDTKSSDFSPLTEKEIKEGTERLDLLLQELAKDSVISELLADSLPEP
jgi:hypothetical protein